MGSVLGGEQTGVVLYGALHVQREGLQDNGELNTGSSADAQITRAVAAL